jgi:DNA-binding Lrp family transcriptional regulator
MIDKEAIQKRALRLVSQGGKGVAAALSQEFGITRQAAGARLQRMVANGLLAPTGATRNKQYDLADLQIVEASYPRDGLREDIVWRELCAPVVTGFPENVRDIWRYGMTEMINNAIDHSGSPDVTVRMQRNALFTTASVSDRGEGIFLKIQKALNLYDTREAILELAKGKFTTDPANHSGEGIFFSSKVFDLFDIRSGALHFMHDAGLSDVLIERPKDAPGTLVIMRIDNDSERTTKEVFDRFAAPEEYTFAKTIVPVRLAQYEGEKLVSRSQARRLTLRFERFQTVILDFDGVAEIGQAFADEVFRVFQAAHPNTKLIPTHMTEAVENMMKRATARG